MADADDSVEWREIQGFPDYKVGSQGEIRRITRPKKGQCRNRPLPYPLKASANTQGYPFVCLVPPSGGARPIPVHKLVAHAFLSPPLPYQTQVAHWDGNKWNNAVSNLRWVTPLENSADKHRHGTTSRGERHPHRILCNQQVVEIRKLRSSGVILRVLAAQFGVSESAILDIMAQRTWKHVP